MDEVRSDVKASARAPATKSGSVLAAAATVVISVLVAWLLSVVVDRLVGRVAPPSPAPGAAQIVFPAGSRMEFETTEFHYVVEANSLGLRDWEFDPQDFKGFRVAAIGDSFTYGWGVALEETWVKRLEQNLAGGQREVQVINVGKPGADPRVYEEIAERALPILRPDLVIVALLQVDDLADLGNEPPVSRRGQLVTAVHRVYPNLTRLVHARWGRPTDAVPGSEDVPPIAATAEQNRAYSQEIAASVIKNMSPQRRAIYADLEDGVKQKFLAGDLNPALISVATRYPGRLLFDDAAMEDRYAETCIDRAAKYLRRIEAFARACGAEVIVVSVPEGVYVNHEAHRNRARVGFIVEPDLLKTLAPDEAIRTAAERAGLPFFSVMEGFRERCGETGLYFELDGHFTAAGHRLFAELITPIVRDLIGGMAQPVGRRHGRHEP